LNALVRDVFSLTSVEQSSYEAFVRALICVLGIALFAAGCFNPSIESGGFACDPSVSDACPSGFYCVNALCVNHPGPPGTGGGGTTDMSVSGDSDLSMPSGTPDDLAMTHEPADLAKAFTPDLATPPPPPDFAQPPPVNTCAHDVCTVGDPLTKGCDPCVTAVCKADSYCCGSGGGTWDDQCVEETDEYCTGSEQC
jgi:hypothetical protein